MSFLLFLAAAGLGQTTAPPSSVDVRPSGDAAIKLSTPKDPLAEQLDQAETLIKTNDPYDALPILDKVIAAEEEQHRGEKRLIYSARSPEESLFYMMGAATQKKNAVALDNTWSTAYFLKGFALIDLNRADEAKSWFDKAVALSPMNSQFLAERGEWYKSRKNWDAAYTDFASASEAANFAPDQVKSFEQRRAWRGMAYARTEQGKLDEALGLLQKCLKLDPNDDKCQHEVDYVNGLKKGN